MKSAQAVDREVHDPVPAKFRLLQMLIVLGFALVSCTAETVDSPQAAVPGQPAESSLATIDKQLHESAVAAPTTEAEAPTTEAEKSTTKTESSVSPSEKAEKSTWKKNKDAQKVASDSEAAARQPATAKAVDLTEDVEAGPHARMRIKRIEQTQSEAEGIGQIAGNATLVEIELSNDGTTTLNLDTAQVRLFYGEDREPAALLADTRSAELPAELAAGKQATATCLFSAQTASDTDVTLEFETGATKKIQQLAGEVSP
ncbi:hypothetical protein [Arthrobacter sp. NIO-1057]|uniref:hypothetical protein n=1 Tax=Arthrobacter sp. NIO-1057 TaxID=993071 RepID=UPI00071E42A7|nr:hypothetical protein [Arthrobacter sp. NIO-1057]KSU67682.1 hypothetical protein AS038_00820 [Arthrobacter sp. NIO-1057]SCB75788.1 hypothetical protein GA0061084_0168 [Arthrobacter sp. NIO-1057]